MYGDIQIELYHHGIKGMKWGIRRFQNKNGSLTALGRKRKQNDSSNTNQPKKKSKHRIKLEETYKRYGMSQKDAELAASKRIRTEKILAVSAGLTVAACAAYIANEKRKSKIDGIIKAGENLQRIEMQDTGGKLHDTFYAAKGKHDSKRYKGLLGMTRQMQTGEAYVMKLQANTDIKVASKDKATKIFGDLYKNDSDFKNTVEDYVQSTFAGKNKVVNTNDLSDRNIRKMYENFNANLVGLNRVDSNTTGKFYNKLKSSGYGAIQDINDMKFSGYKAKNPLIIFDNADNKNIMVNSIEKINKNMAASGTRELLKASCERSLEKIGPLAAITLTGATINTYTKDPVDDVVLKN